jgi:RHS repeat-associated protein
MGRTSNYQSNLNVPWVQTNTSTFSQQHTNNWPNGLQATSTKTQQGSQISDSSTLPDGSSSSDTFGPDPVWGIQAPVITSETLTEGNLTMDVVGNRTATLGTAGNPFSLTNRTDTTSANFRTYTSNFTASNLTSADTTPVGRQTTTVLDNQERIASLQIAGLQASNFTYDSRGRLSTVTQGTRTSTFTYDANGRLATATDPLGLKKSYSYDAAGRLLSTTLPDGRVIAYSYDNNGNLTSITPPGESAHSFAYTAVNEVSAYTPPAVSGTGATTYTYNLDRDMTKVTRADGNTISYSYDSAGRVSSLVTPSETINYNYDSTTGNLSFADIASGESLTFGYNGPLPTSTSWTGAISGTVSRTYNDNFWMASQSINGGNTIAFSYDNDGLVTKAGALALARSPQNGLIAGTTLGPASDSRTYNSFGELTGYTASYGNGQLYHLLYARDADGRISNKTEIRGFHITTYAYSYDPAGRLIGVSKNGVPFSSYGYDSNSNRVQATTSSGTVSATYDAQDRLLTYGNATYTYTANGELASQTSGGQTTTYQYDVLGNLLSVTLPSGKAISYVVDAKNRRVGKMVNGTLVEGFLYDGDRIVAQVNGNTLVGFPLLGHFHAQQLRRQESNTNASNGLVSRFIYASSATSPDYMISGGVTYRIFSDPLGSPLLVVNTSTGAIAEQITYDEFGNVLSDTNPGFQPFGFAGGLYDQDTKLVRFGARDYDPSTGRWTAKDPTLFIGGDTDLYGYLRDDPVNWVDPAGRGGVGTWVGGIAEAGTGIGFGGSVQGTVGGGFFPGGAKCGQGDVDYGSWVSGGGHLGAGVGEVGGASAGIGVGGYVTTANSVEEMEGPSESLNINVGFISLQYSTSGAVQTFSFGVSKSWGLSVSHYKTTTKKLESHSCVCGKTENSIRRIYGVPY